MYEQCILVTEGLFLLIPFTYLPYPQSSSLLVTSHLVSASMRQSSYGVLLLLSRFSCVRLCATPQMAAHQAPPSLGLLSHKRKKMEFCHLQQDGGVWRMCLVKRVRASQILYDITYMQNPKHKRN